MNVIEKFNIIPLNQLPENQFNKGKEVSALPILLIGLGVIVTGFVLYHIKMKETQEREKTHG